jgi:hypothetical protein
MKILFWETEYPKDRIIIIVILLIPLLYLFRGLGRSRINAPNVIEGITYRIGGLYTGYVGPGTWWTYHIVFYLILFLLLIIVVSFIQITVLWYRKHNSI